jgi:6-phosphogluconolactonase
MSEVIKLSTPEAVAEEAARRWVNIAQTSINERGRFDIALSGGSTPAALYRLMASDAWRDQAPWAQTFVFWSDERRVAASHPDSNYRMARETLLDHVPVPQEQIFRMPSEGLATGDMREYENKLRRHFALGPRDWPRFDLMLLGLGQDGHTASIFPGTRAISDKSTMVIVYDVPQHGGERITLTFPTINHSRNVIFLVTGKDKAQAVANTLQGPRKVNAYPTQGVVPVNGTLTWLIDDAAASLLT